MFHLRKLIAAAALATVALIGAPGQQAQAATELGVIQSAVIGKDYTFNTTVADPNSVPIGPTTYAFTFTPAATNAVLVAAFSYTRVSGTFTGGFLSWSDGVSLPVTKALVAGVQTTLEIPLAAAGPNQTLTIGFGSQTGFGVLAGGVTAIPLPASGLLLLAGLGAVALIRRRTVKHAA